MQKGWKEDFAKFFENPSRENLRELLRNQVGEFDHIDFKGEWLEDSKLARHLLGFANSGGGCLVIGIAENVDKSFDVVGLPAFRDKTKVKNGVQKFIPSQLKYEIFDFPFEASEYPKLVGKKFQVVLVEDMPQYIPFLAESDGKDIRRNAVYIRRGAATEETTYEELQTIINRRIETQYSSQTEFSLKNELDELRFLYNQIPQRVSYATYYGLSSEDKPNPKYPKDTFEDFIISLINTKKEHILKLFNNTKH